MSFAESSWGEQVTGGGNWQSKSAALPSEDRIAQALESIAASLEKIANPMVAMNSEELAKKLRIRREFGVAAEYGLGPIRVIEE